MMIPGGKRPPWPRPVDGHLGVVLTRERRHLLIHEILVPHRLQENKDDMPKSIPSRPDRVDRIRKLSSSLLSDRTWTLLPVILLGTRVVTMIDPCATAG